MKQVFALAVLALAAGASHAQLAAAQSQAGSASQAGAASMSGAMGNQVLIDQSVPAQQSITYSTRAEQILNGQTAEAIHYSGSTTVKNVPAIAMSGPASGPCSGFSGGLSAAGPGWGVGFNGSSVMADCRFRENVRVLGMGMQSIDAGAYPQEKGETMVMFMDAMRALSKYNTQLAEQELKK